jgi:hypothetical protein
LRCCPAVTPMTLYRSPRRARGGHAHGPVDGRPHLSNLCILPAWTRWLISPAAETIPRIFRIMDTFAVTDRTLQGMARVRRNPAAAATIDLRQIVTASAVQLDPAHEADARFFESDRGCWKAGLRSAGLTNACGRRPSAPLRKVIESPVQCGGQAGCRVFLRHISIMRLLSLGYEPDDARLWRLKQSPSGAVTSADGTDHVAVGWFRLPRSIRSRRVQFTNRFTEQPLDLRFLRSLRARLVAVVPRPRACSSGEEGEYHE